VLGSDFGICDIYLFTLAHWLEGDGVDVRALPRVADHSRRVSEAPAVRRALVAEQSSA
jgi:glutathione S-transferase